MAGRSLKKIQQEVPDLQIEQVEVISEPGRTWSDGIRMIPAIKKGNEILSGLFLTTDSIRNFIRK
ncbi:MAG: hypothetical protein KKG47_10150 [Proteobacteria bacterium]|nr:hypothetical protein [Pseudomonadota bacterium]MBU1737661.1 hypothetical protein [Pseudomonadota bacterium]